MVRIFATSELSNYLPYSKKMGYICLIELFTLRSKDILHLSYHIIYTTITQCVTTEL